MRRVAAAIIGLLCSLAAGASAGPNPVHAGPQAVPPVAAAEINLRQELDGRRHVRGCAVGEDCGRAQDVLREFELERLPPPGRDPWIDERTALPSRLEAGPLRVVTRPSELRPDAPWLDKLAMPDLPVRWSQRLADYLVFYRDDPRGRSIMESWLVAQGRYRDLIVSHLRKAKLPEDLLYVAMIESSYDPTTLSRAGALGLWQWMRGGAKIYGLRRDHWVDERRDPYRATIAQMDYFRDLYQRFGDWHIALAAFNAGYGALLQAITRYNTNDYYQLCAYENAIAWETCWYTPKVLATAIVGNNRAAFGFDQVKPAPAEAWDAVAVPTSMRLSVVARAAGATEAELEELNPHLRRGRTPPGEPGYLVRVPPGTKAQTRRRLAELQSDWDGYDAYVVAHGERFEDVATTYGISSRALRKLNGVSHASEIEGGTVLVVPRVSAAERARNRAKAKADLHTSGIDQQEGEPLLVPVLDKDAVIAGKQRVFYRVVTGDDLGEVAKVFDVSERELAMWNGLEPGAYLHPRMVLVAWVPTGFDAARRRLTLLDESQLLIVTRGSPEHLDLAEARRGRVRTEYVAKGTEKLGTVAKKFGMTAGDLARINRFSYNKVLEKGDTIIVYQVVDPSRSERAEEQWKKTPKSRRGKVAKERAIRTVSAADIDAKRAEVKKADTKPETEKADAKSDVNTDSAKPELKKADAKPEAKKADATSDVKTDSAKPEAKQDGAKPEAKQADARPDAKKADAPSEATKTGAKVDATKAEEKLPERKSVEANRTDEPSPDPESKRSLGLSGPVTKPTQLD